MESYYAFEGVMLLFALILKYFYDPPNIFPHKFNIFCIGCQFVFGNHRRFSSKWP